MTSRIFTDPSDDYSLPKGLAVDDEPWLANWKTTIKNDMEHVDEGNVERSVEVQFEQQERELEFDEPRWGEMGGEEE